MDLLDHDATVAEQVLDDPRKYLPGKNKIIPRTHYFSSYGVARSLRNLILGRMTCGYRIWVYCWS